TMKGKVRPGKHRGERVFIAEGRDPLTGKRRRFYSSSKTTAERTQKSWNEEEFAAEHEEPLHPLLDPAVSVSTYVEAYLEQRDPKVVSTSPWRPKTYRSVKDALVQHVLPFVVGPGERVIGDRRIRDWHRRWLPMVAEAKRAEGYARDSVRIIV